jgi:hypothetical protein
MHVESMHQMAYFRDKYVTPGMSVLDIGSRRVNKRKVGVYRSLFSDCRYVGMDIVAGKNVDIVGYENIVGVFDIVISGQVMEHVLRPWDWLKNLNNYFSKYICIIAPNTGKEHRHPLDTYRYFPDGMKDLFEYAGIKELEIYRHKKDTIGIGSKKDY